MSSLHTLREIILKMTAEERSAVAVLFNAFEQNPELSSSLYFKLFDLMCREIKTGEHLSDAQIEEYLYNSLHTTAFPKLVIRLKMRLIEFLSLSMNLEKKGAYSDRGRIIHQIRKKLSAAQILSFRGSIKLSNSLLDECITYSKKYEFIEEWLTALRLRTQSYVIDDNSKMVSKCSEEYDRVVKVLVAVKKAQTYYAEICSQLEHKSSPIDIEMLELKVKELQHLYKETKSANVAFFQCFLHTHLFQERRQYVNASEVLQKQLKIIEKSPALNSPERQAVAYLNLAWNELLTFRFKNTLKYSKFVMDILPKNSTNRYQNHLARFFAYFYMGEYENASDILEEMNLHYNNNEADYMIGKRIYFKSCILFMEKKHKQVNELLRELNPLEKDNEGWSFWFKILHIMNDIETENTESAFNKIGGFRKQLNRISESNRDYSRLKIIYEILNALGNCHFDFSVVRNKKSTELKQLEHKEQSSWRITSPELIIFDQWFESHYYRTKFKQTIPDYWEPAQTA
jgi:hypothetical protein